MPLTDEQTALLDDLRKTGRRGVWGWNFLILAVLASWAGLVYFAPVVANPLVILREQPAAHYSSDTLEQLAIFVPLLISLIFAQALVLIFSARNGAKLESRLLEIIERLEQETIPESESSGDSWRLE